MAEPAANLAPVPELLRACADELAAVAELGLRLERTLAALTPQLGARMAVIEEMQGLDRLVQHAAALHAFLLSAAATAPAEHALDVKAALDAVTLEAMSVRLSRQLLGREPEDSWVLDSGEVEFL